MQTFVIVLFGVVILFAVVAISGAVVVRRKRLKPLLTGIGSPGTPVSNDPWRRFGCAIAAVYARNEWHSTRGARRLLRAEQTYFGYGCILTPPWLFRALAGNWGVRKPEQARVQVSEVAESAEISAARIAAARGENAQLLHDRLIAAGAPRDVAETMASRVLVAKGAAGSHQVQTPGEMAFDLARFANLIRWCGSAGHIAANQAHPASDALAAAALTVFDGWDAFGEEYLVGLRGFTSRGIKPFARAIEWLLTDHESPWQQLPWPGAPVKR